MPRLIRWRDGAAAWAEDAFTAVDDDQPMPPGDVIISLSRYQREGRVLLEEGRNIGVKLASDEAPEALVVDISRLAVIALTFPKFRDGRGYSAARVLRERLDFKGEIRAVGDVFVEMGSPLIRCGFDAAAPTDGSTPVQWTQAGRRFRHVYQRAADGRTPAFAERLGA